MKSSLPKLLLMSLGAVALASCVPAPDTSSIDDLGSVDSGAGFGTGGAAIAGTGGAAPGTGGQPLDPTGTGGQIGTGGRIGTGGQLGTGGNSGTGGMLGGPDAGMTTGGRTSTDGGRPDGGADSGTGGRAQVDAGAPADSGSTASVCTSKVMYSGGNGATMQPGNNCKNCHSFSISGTVYPTSHEPDGCNGVNGNTGVRVVITGSNGQALTLTPSAAGNFYSNTAVSSPFTVKITNGTATRAMVTPQTVGACNSCHTQAGDMNAPGRIISP